MNTKALYMFLGFLIITVLVIFGILRFSKDNQGRACTAEAKMCPDGSYVGRTGPLCEFTQCPEVKIIEETGRLGGQVTISPICPVERIPPDPNCAPKPFVTDVSVSIQGSNKINKSIKTTTQGDFTFELPVGTYLIRAESGKVFPRCEDKTILIVRGQSAVVDISCDSGIR